ncbi:hypothetical protein QQF64_022202 [Cirrhinus molitorella]|uniref:Uncharacterized protein n=1 Tax=Cirrhinus molitorella TaxID=172907 RepID=A0ABR3L7I2_9TELE
MKEEFDQSERWVHSPFTVASGMIDKCVNPARLCPVTVYTHCTILKKEDFYLLKVNGVEEKGYDRLPPVDESVAVHLCLPMAIGWKAVLQVYQAKLLRSMDEAGPDQTAFKDLRMASLVVLERHLWLSLTEIKDADKVPFLDSPVSPTGLFGPAVEGFAERFTAVQKTSHAMVGPAPKMLSLSSPRSVPGVKATMLV